MGVEPTAARSARPATDFEDRGTHRGTTTPVSVIRIPFTKISVAENDDFATELDRRLIIR
jgi:hypothetical protein